MATSVRCGATQAIKRVETKTIRETGTQGARTLTCRRGREREGRSEIEAEKKKNQTKVANQLPRSELGGSASFSITAYHYFGVPIIAATANLSLADVILNGAPFRLSAGAELVLRHTARSGPQLDARSILCGQPRPQRDHPQRHQPGRAPDHGQRHGFSAVPHLPIPTTALSLARCLGALRTTTVCKPMWKSASPQASTCSTS